MPRRLGVYPALYLQPSVKISKAETRSSDAILNQLSIGIAVIAFCTQIGRKFPALDRLIPTMPLTGAIVLVWRYSDDRGNFSLMQGYTKGALWGIAPSVPLLVVAYARFRSHLPLHH